MFVCDRQQIARVIHSTFNFYQITRWVNIISWKNNDITKHDKPTNIGHQSGILSNHISSYCNLHFNLQKNRFSYIKLEY